MIKKVSMLLQTAVILIILLTTINAQQNSNFRVSENIKSNQTTAARVGLDEKLGQYIPKGLEFFNEDGQKIKLDSLITKPVIFAFVYYHCPGICSPLLMGVSEVVDRVDLEPGKDFQVVTLSFDNSETPADAKKWKQEHLNSMRRNMPDGSWTFLTGDSANIIKLTDAVGFYFKPEGDNDFAHPTALITITNKGMISRYILGTSFLPFDIKMAVLEASKGVSSPTVNKILEYCFSYDRASNSYVFNIKKIAGSILLLLIAGFFTILIVKSKKKKV